MFNPQLNAYLARDKKWIKTQLFAHLKKCAATHCPPTKRSCVTAGLRVVARARQATG